MECRIENADDGSRAKRFEAQYTQTKSGHTQQLGGLAISEGVAEFAVSSEPSEGMVRLDLRKLSSVSHSSHSPLSKGPPTHLLPTTLQIDNPFSFFFVSTPISHETYSFRFPFFLTPSTQSSGNSSTFSQRTLLSTVFVLPSTSVSLLPRRALRTYHFVFSFHIAIVYAGR